MKIRIPVNGDILNEASLYFHIPFCSKKCPYCHFYVIPNKERYHHELLEALALEWKMIAPSLASKKIVSIYFGGGTPSLFGPKNIGAILQWIERDGIAKIEGCEITLEANPENLSPSLLKDYFSIGINRLSIGVQSLEDTSLLVLGRGHSASLAKEGIHHAFEAGFKNISIDLMYDLPSQTEKSWQNTLLEIKTLPITHLSLYNLTLEPHTVFFKKRKELTPLLPSPDVSLAMLDEAVSSLESIGLKRYEISAFAKPNLHSIHNTGYWKARPFFGLGPSAFSYWKKKRFRNIANLSRYAQKLKDGLFPIDFEEQLPYPDNIAELLAVELRLIDGIDVNFFESRHGPLPDKIKETVRSLQNKGWLEEREDRIKLTSKGLLFYDSAAEEII